VEKANNLQILLVRWINIIFTGLYTYGIVNYYI
jgi:hypothetical protein